MKPLKSLPSRRRATALAVATLAPLTASVWAQTVLPRVEIIGNTQSYDASQTSSATKTDTPTLLTPQSLQVVPRAVLNDQKALTLSDAVRNVAGVGTDFGFNGSAQPLLILRGFQSTSMTARGNMSGMSSYFINGVKVQGVPLNMANVDSVEVVKGPASVLYGRSEPGGLVNVVPKALTATPRLGLEQTIGQYGLSRSLIEGGGALNADDTLLGRASLSYDRNKSNRDFVENKLGSFSGSIAWVPDAVTRVALTVDHNAQKYRNDFGIPADGNRPADLPRSRQYNDSPELSTIRSDSVLLDAQTELATNWTLKGRVVSLRSKTHEVDVWPYRENLLGADTCNNAAGLTRLCRYYFYVRPEGRVKLDQATVDLIGEVQVAGLQHKLLAEIDHFRTKKTGDVYFTQINSVDVYNPVLGSAPPLDTSFPQPVDDYNRWTSLTLQDQIAFGNGWHGVFALRHDRTEALYSLTPNIAPNKQSFTSPRIGAVWAFQPNQSLYAQYQDSIAANNGRNAAPPVGDGRALDAERARQIEFGWKQAALAGRLNTTVAVYQLVKRNRAFFFPNGTAVTIGEARSRGLEVDAIGQISEQLSMIASYTYLDAKVTKDPDPTVQGTRQANAARNAGSLWGRWMFDEQWAAGAGVFMQGQRQGDYKNTFQLPGYARVDAMASYAFKAGGSKGSVQFNLKNVFDKVYFSGSHPIVQDWIQPGPPRTASLTLRLDY